MLSFGMVAHLGAVLALMDGNVAWPRGPMGFKLHGNKPDGSLIQGSLSLKSLSSV